MQITGDILQLTFLWTVWIVTCVYKMEIYHPNVEAELVFPSNTPSPLDKEISLINGIKDLFGSDDRNETESNDTQFSKFKRKYNHYKKYQMYLDELQTIVISEVDYNSQSDFTNIRIFRYFTQNETLIPCLSFQKKYAIDHVEFNQGTDKLIIIPSYESFIETIQLECQQQSFEEDSVLAFIQARESIYPLMEGQRYSIANVQHLKIINQDEMIHVNNNTIMISTQDQSKIISQFEQGSYHQILYLNSLKNESSKLIYVYTRVVNGSYLFTAEILDNNEKLIIFSVPIDLTIISLGVHKKPYFQMAISPDKSIIYFFLKPSLNYLYNVEEQKLIQFKLQVIREEKIFKVKSCKFTQNGHYVVLQWTDDKNEDSFSFFSVKTIIYRFNRPHFNIDIEIFKIKEMKRRLDNLQFRSFIAVEHQNNIQLYTINHQGQITKISFKDTMDFNKTIRISVLDLIGCLFLCLGGMMGFIQFRNHL